MFDRKAGMKQSQHNKRVFEDIRPGDILKLNRSIYSHYAIYLGDAQIAHLVCAQNNSNSEYGKTVTSISTLKRTDYFSRTTQTVARYHFWDFVGDGLAFIDNCDDKLRPLPEKQIIQNVKNGSGYSIIFKNCEHFANSCRYGRQNTYWMSNVLFRFLLIATMLSFIAVLISRYYDM